MEKQQIVNLIEEERSSFDKQIIERVKHGHIPDLRHEKRNEWFYNNVWRDPEYVKMSFLENINFLRRYLKKNSKILEIGCGPGHNSLELARNGHNVTGIDLSPACIEVAKKTLAQNTYYDGFGSLDYCSGDFMNTDIPNKPFDAVLFYGALSHFPNPDKALERVSELLVPKGTILIWDTCVDLYSEKDATILCLIRSILAYTGHYYKKEELAEDESVLHEKINRTLNELKYLDEKGLNVQSPNDNASTYEAMIQSLEKKFNLVELLPESCFYRNIIGGIRFDEPEDEHAMAHFIKLVERFLIDNKELSPAFFYYIGTKR